MDLCLGFAGEGESACRLIVQGRSRAASSIGMASRQARGKEGHHRQHCANIHLCTRIKRPNGELPIASDKSWSVSQKSSWLWSCGSRPSREGGRAAGPLYRPQATGCPQWVSQTSLHVNTVSATKTDSPGVLHRLKRLLGYKLRDSETRGLRYSLPVWIT